MLVKMTNKTETFASSYFLLFEKEDDDVFHKCCFDQDLIA